MKDFNALQKNCAVMVMGAILYSFLYTLAPTKLLLGCFFICSLQIYGIQIVEEIKTNFDHSVFAQEMWYAITLASLSMMTTTVFVHLGLVEGILVLGIVTVFLVGGAHVSKMKMSWVVATIVFGVSMQYGIVTDGISYKVLALLAFMALVVESTSKDMWNREIGYN